jgi:hypothetical protein
MALAAPAFATGVATAIPLYPSGRLGVNCPVLNRGQRRLALGDRQSEILRTFRHLEGRASVVS